jgi:hypothetical protein
MKSARTFRFIVAAASASLAFNACGMGGCSEYASAYSCSYVENRAEYEVWYWRNVERDEEDDNQLIGRAVGLRMCEGNARAHAAAIGEEFNYRAYSCILIDDGRRMETHRLLPSG